jgi:DNA-directed RNA polymerase specialized sigma24 family protein
MRFFSTEDLDLFEAPPSGVRIERLRELVDELPRLERHLVSRVFFGGADLQTAGEEVGLSKHRRKVVMERGLETLRKALLEENEVGPL